ncbi:unnamed protein product [Discosporangium mesarthrocarpum]
MFMSMSAEQVVGLPAGACYQVVVDKGPTGLGVTLKAVGGRFTVYSMQLLIDGSVGSVEEAGVQEGDELIGVEELDFEAEPWDIAQLVSYMKDLSGVVMLRFRRASRSLLRIPEPQEQGPEPPSVLMQEQRQIDGDIGGGRGRGGGKVAGGSGEEGGQRLVDVLVEDGLVKEEEAMGTRCLLRQVWARAQLWDTGELWHPVCGSKAVIPDTLRQGDKDTLLEVDGGTLGPGMPVTPGAGGGDLRKLPLLNVPPPAPPPSQNEVTLEWITGEAGPRDCVGAGHRDGRESQELNSIGEVLLGQPLFGPGGRVDTSLAGLWSGDRNPGSAGRGQGLGPGPEPGSGAVAGAGRGGSLRLWRPHGEVVSTQGLRKALNVRLLSTIAGDSPGQERPSGLGRGWWWGGGGGRGDVRSVPSVLGYLVWVMDVESGAEWQVTRTYEDFLDLRVACVRLRPSLARVDFPQRLAGVKETLGVAQARQPRIESFLQRLCSSLYLSPLHPSSSHVAHMLQDFLGTTSRVEMLEQLQRSRPERELRQALQVHTCVCLSLYVCMC